MHTSAILQCLLVVSTLSATADAMRECGISKFNTHRQPRGPGDATVGDLALHTLPQEDLALYTLPQEDLALHTLPQEDLALHTLPQEDLALHTLPREDSTPATQPYFGDATGGSYPYFGEASASDGGDAETNRTDRSRPNNRMMVFEDSSTGRIVGGKESKAGAWPWQVSLQLVHPRWGRIGHWCGGVLIDQSWVVTAAHCINNKAFSFTKTAAVWQVVLGEHDRSHLDGREVVLGVITVVTHNEFNDYQNDIAMMKLRRDVLYTDRIQPICLPDTEPLEGETFLGIKCVATGWGMRVHGARLEDRLKEVTVPVVNNSHCVKMYGMMHNIPVRQYHMCAGQIKGQGVGTCIGDSGGPLQCNMRDGRWYLAGVTSFGSGCAKPGFPDVYTRITYYLPWIKQQMRIHR